MKKFWPDFSMLKALVDDFESKVWVLFLAAFLLRIVIVLPFYSGDVGNHLVWGKSIVEKGLANFYHRDFGSINTAYPTYGPLLMLSFALFYILFVLVHQVVWFLNLNVPVFPSKLVYFFSYDNQNLLAAFLKMPAIISDLLVGLFIFLIAKNVLKNKWPVLVTAAYLLNPAVFYSSANWGQVESVVLAWVLGSIYFVFAQKLWPAIFFIAAAILTKQTVWLLMPVIIVIFLRYFNLVQVIQASIAIVLLVLVSYCPFFTHNPLTSLNFYIGAVDFVTDKVYENAFNFWYFVLAPENPTDLDRFLGLSYRLWGYFLTILFLLPSLLLLAKRTRPKVTAITAGCLIIAAFLFLTRMHERYLAFSLPFLLLTGESSLGFWGAYLFLSFFHLLNLYSGFLQPNISFLNFLIGNVVIVKSAIVVVGGILVFLVLFLWRKTNDEKN